MSGAISEEVKYRLDVEKETKIGVAKAVADGISRMKLPETMILGGGSSNNGSGTTFENLLQLMVVEKANNLNQNK